MSAKSRVANKPKCLREGKPHCEACGHFSSNHLPACCVAMCSCKKFVSKKKTKKKTNKERK